MDTPPRTDPAHIIPDAISAVSWASIADGAVAAAALMLPLLALGAGLGLSSVSPWAGSGVSASTFKLVTPFDETDGLAGRVLFCASSDEAVSVWVQTSGTCPASQEPIVPENVSCDSINCLLKRSVPWDVA